MYVTSWNYWPRIFSFPSILYVPYCPIRHSVRLCANFHLQFVDTKQGWNYIWLVQLQDGKTNCPLPSPPAVWWAALLTVLGRARCVAQLNEILPRMQEALGDRHQVLTLYGCDYCSASTREAVLRPDCSWSFWSIFWSWMPAWDTWGTPPQGKITEEGYCWSL